MTTIQNEAHSEWLYATVQQFAKRYPAFSVGGLRHQIFHESSNGLKESKAIVRNGRRVLINEPRYFLWLEAQGGAK